MKKVLFILLLITLLGALIRYYKLGEAPKGLYIDEAGQGYAAYSILKTGADEFGKPFPVVFRSFTDFKTPVYIYMITPLIPVFGLSAYTVRFPSFLFSVLTFPLLYLLITKLTEDKKLSVSLALLATLLLAISPWHTLFGRTNFECNVALFIYLLGIYLFYLSLKKPPLLILSAIVFALSLPAYHSERFLTPITALFLFIRYQKTLLSRPFKKYLLISAFIAFLITLPTLSVSLTPGFLARASGLNIFSTENHLPSGFISNLPEPLSSIVNTQLFLSTREFASLYFAYFSPRNMFSLGDYGPRSSFPDLSTFYIWQFPFYILGLYLLLKRKELGELRTLIIFLLLAAPIPAAITRDPYTTIRALPLVIPQNILIALGILQVYLYLKPRLRPLSALLFSALILYSILNLYSSAITLNEFYRAKNWDYGFKEVALFLKDKYLNTPVVFDNSRNEPYIELAFFLSADPKAYQRDNFEVPLNEYYTNMQRNTEKHIGKIVTRPINWEQDLMIDQYLAGDELSISYNQIEEHKLFLEKEILFPDSSHAFRIVRTNPEYEKNQRKTSSRN